jgi:hypothetical protein
LVAEISKAHLPRLAPTKQALPLRLRHTLRAFFTLGSIINVVVSEKEITTFLNLWAKKIRDLKSNEL